MKTTAQRLEAILERLDAGRDREAAEREAAVLLRELSAGELVRAEEELARRGMPREKMRHLCPSHLGAVRENGGARGAFRAQLPDGHVLATLMDEHVQILGQLDRLEELVSGLESPRQRDVLEEIRGVAARLIGAEPHHQREEQVLFPELVGLGIEGPPRVMEMEHVELRALKHSVEELAAKGLAGDASAAASLPGRARALVGMLRDHIAKEDEILYPIALQAVAEGRWAELRRRCDEIGYCCGHHGS